MALLFLLANKCCSRAAHGSGRREGSSVVKFLTLGHLLTVFPFSVSPLFFSNCCLKAASATKHKKKNEQLRICIELTAEVQCDCIASAENYG